MRLRVGDVMKLVAISAVGLAGVEWTRRAETGSPINFVWGEAGRSSMPAGLVDSVSALRTAVAELMASAAMDRPGHPCDVRFGREITRVLAEAEAQLSARPA